MKQLMLWRSISEMESSLKKSVTNGAATLLIVLLSFSGISLAQPALVHSRSLAAPGESGNGFKILYGGSMGTGTLAGNLLTVRMTYAHGLTVSSIQDNKGSSYTLGVSSDSGSGVG